MVLLCGQDANRSAYSRLLAGPKSPTDGVYDDGLEHARLEEAGRPQPDFQKIADPAEITSTAGDDVGEYVVTLHGRGGHPVSLGLLGD